MHSKPDSYQSVEAGEEARGGKPLIDARSAAQGCAAALWQVPMRMVTLDAPRADLTPATNGEGNQVGKASHPIARVITILALEDDPNDRFFLQRALNSTGIRCNLVYAHNGVAAQDVLKTMEQSAGTQNLVVFSDVDMPNQNGLEFLKWLKGEPQFHRLPVVMLSSFDNLRDMNRAFEFGASACMIKPPDPNAVKGLLQTIQSGQFGANEAKES